MANPRLIGVPVRVGIEACHALWLAGSRTFHNRLSGRKEGARLWLMRQLRGTELKRFVKGLRAPPGQLVVVLHDVEDPVNVGSAFRIADAAGVSRLELVGITPSPPHKLIAKVGRGKDSRVPHQHTKDIGEVLGRLREEGFRIYAVELTDRSVPYDQASYPEKVALVLGHEDHGVTKKALELCHEAVYVPMFGKGASLNVHVAMAVASFEVMRIWRTQGAV